MLEPLSSWKNGFANLPLVADASWKQNLADLVDGLVTNKLTIIGITPNAVFTFNKTLFRAGLEPLVATTNTLQAATTLAQAWGSAVTASSVVVSSGAYVGVAAPATTFSAPPVTIILPVTAAQLTLQNAIVSLPLTANAQDSQFPKALRDAFLGILTTTTGLSSIPPPTGPTPLIAAGLTVG